ncbi:hypothetical protein [Paracoccus siganidrum]|uniref:Uncharacterized protein n=1 Tax=Paracoccus siganidrum TaxID=1276757 RepID=A0A419A722_9RHOB|nr:hypothetical protein [Paracoccus siganidrum]RJL15810.1 hypothetical protein D3P05_10510 [Paracoccus siganidrum]RMC29377.1 hypothetical protein C9E82_20490 [Paracoccus siganidrum]
MTLSRQAGLIPIGEIVAREVLPRLRHAQKLPLRISCCGAVGYHGLDDADGFDRMAVIGECPSPKDAMMIANRRVAHGDIRIDTDDTLRFRPRIVIIQDRDLGLVLAGEIRAGIVIWQQPVASDTEARRVVTEASRLRSIAFSASGRGDAASTRDHRARASLLEARLVDPYWRETAADLLRLPRAA